MSKGRVIYTSTDMGKLQEKDACRHGIVMLLMYSHHIDNGLPSILKDTALYEGIQILNDKKGLMEIVRY